MWRVLMPLAAISLSATPPILAKASPGKPSEELAIYVGPWGECEPVSGSSSSTPNVVVGYSRIRSPGGSLTFEPQVGEQTRDVRCRDAYGAPLDIKYCASTGVTVARSRRVCIVTTHCQVSEWSPWRATCASHGNTRTRNIISLPQGNGKQCGPLEERNEVLGIASDRAKAVHWAPSPWSACRVTEDHIVHPILYDASSQMQKSFSCGGGLQRRSVTCVSSLHGGSISPESSTGHQSACDHLPHPATVQRCEVPCPRDCVVGDWSEWGPCEPLAGCPMTPVEELTTNGNRRRTRRVLVAASAIGGSACPALSEVQACGRAECAHWAAEPWSACRRPPHDKTACGPGVRQRAVTCVDLHGSPLDKEMCALWSAPPSPARMESCLVPCPDDCVVSAWSPWSPCSSTCSTKHSKGFRTRNRTIIAPPREGGRACGGPEALTQEKSCNIHGCHGYSWLSLPWQSCQPEEDPSEKTPADEEYAKSDLGEDLGISEEEKRLIEERRANDCGEGLIQTREVWCMQNNDRKIEDTLCSPLKKPETRRPCSVICPRDCRTSDWSEWTPCPAGCEGGFQERSRRVLEASSGGGMACGALRERRSCPLTTSSSVSTSASSSPSATVSTHDDSPARWSHGAWSPCRLPRDQRCGEGLMTRGVWCSQQHHKVPPSACLENIPPPASHLRCSVDCRTGCQLSDWSPWSRCAKECGGVSTRSRKKLGNSPCPNTVLYEGHECPCGIFHSKPTPPWSKCLVLSGPEDFNIPAVPEYIGDVERLETVPEWSRPCGVGVGYRFRRLVCSDVSGRIVEPHHCQHHSDQNEPSGFAGLSGLVRESCSTECPVDCRMSRWSAWGNCEGKPCGISLQRRTRNILVNASSGGRPCGVTTQTKVCKKPCEGFAWVTGGWSSCNLIPRHQAQGCGTGDQYRTVRCMELTNGLPVEDALCDPLSQPADLNACHLSCPGECVVSEWSEWSQCPKPCWGGSRRDRTRALLRGPSRSSRSDCPPLVQAQACLLNRTCFDYAWRATAWGSCLPLGGSSCGEGMQQRAIYCERSDGRQVSDQFCDMRTHPSEPSEKFCYEDCPIDCELSDWSDWETRQCTCGTDPDNAGNITRARIIINEASAAGRACPYDLMERVPCPLTPCYILHKTPFTHCYLDQGATCGYGVRYRNVTCVRETDGEQVTPSLCSPHLTSFEDTLKEESCYVDCNDDCRYSPWSQWSSCDSGGVRFRKRVSFKPPGPPCVENVLRYEVFEYANCNATESELNKDISEWNNYDEAATIQDQEDYYVHNDQPEKTYLLFTGKKIPDEHTALAVGIASASMVILMLLVFLTIRCHKQRTVHKV